ncbi:gliding motility-associated C-terminal domain-containing protein [Phormidesmis sp. 146-12]
MFTFICKLAIIVFIMRTKTLHCTFISLLLLSAYTRAKSQTLVNTSGNTVQNGAISVEYSIGEIGITTLSANQTYATQGLLQPIYKFKDCNLLQFIPNAFTPNKDNLNDAFGVKNWPAATFFELCVYNRWGELVFKTTSLSDTWNGEYKGKPQPVGTYVYTVKASTAACGFIVNNGTITLIR